MNHNGNANKMVGEYVSNEQVTASATPNGELRRQILSPCVAKNEREWWAARMIEKLEFELNAANDRIKRLEEAYAATEAVKTIRDCWCVDDPDRTHRCSTCGDKIKRYHAAKANLNRTEEAKEAKP